MNYRQDFENIFCRLNSWKGELVLLCILLATIPMTFCSTKQKGIETIEVDKRRLKTNELLKEFNAIELIDTGHNNYSYSLGLQYKDKSVLLQNIKVIDIYEIEGKFYLMAEYTTYYTYFLNVEIPSEKVSELTHCNKLDNIIVKTQSIKKIGLEYSADFHTDYYEVDESESGDSQYEEDTYPIIKIELSDSYVLRGQLLTFECGVD